MEQCKSDIVDWQQNQISSNQLHHHQVNYYKIAEDCFSADKKKIQFDQLNEMLAEMEHGLNLLNELDEKISRLNAVLMNNLSERRKNNELIILWLTQIGDDTIPMHSSFPHRQTIISFRNIFFLLLFLHDFFFPFFSRILWINDILPDNALVEKPFFSQWNKKRVNWKSKTDQNQKQEKSIASQKMSVNQWKMVPKQCSHYSQHACRSFQSRRKMAIKYVIIFRMSSDIFVSLLCGHRIAIKFESLSDLTFF